MRIAIATTTRADWGLLYPLARTLRSLGTDVRIIAAGMHFLESMGLTYKEIEADGFKIDSKVITPGTPADEAAACISGFNAALSEISPDCIVCLGDRFEMLAIAMAASLRHVPIVHIAGGAISEGAFDDAFRHAITKLSSVHLCETPEYRNRVISMGENPAQVHHTGAIGVYNILNTDLMPLCELEKSIGFSLGSDTVLCTMHTATLSEISPERQLGNLLDAIASFPNLRVLFTHPNNDVDPAPLISMLNKFASAQPHKYKVIPSLGRIRYITALHHVAAVIGNSSGGIVEVPSIGIPTLDIGIRQRGRAHADSVIHADADTGSIITGLHTVMSEACREKARHTVNPYHKDNTPALMAEIILNTDFKTILPKKFHDSCPHCF